MVGSGGAMHELSSPLSNQSQLQSASTYRAKPAMGRGVISSFKPVSRNTEELLTVIRGPVGRGYILFVQSFKGFKEFVNGSWRVLRSWATSIAELPERKPQRACLAPNDSFFVALCGTKQTTY
jgi:hypothetical protein